MDLNNQVAHPVDARREEGKSRALAFRIGGLSYREIGRRMEISHQTAYLWVTEALAEIREQNSESAEELRRLELEKLDAMTADLWPIDDTGKRATVDARTADTLLRIAERRANLVGLDAPKRWEGSGPDGGPIRVAQGDIDLSKLTVEELRQLEKIVSKTTPVVALPPSTPQP